MRRPSPPCPTRREPRATIGPGSRPGPAVPGVGCSSCWRAVRSARPACWRERCTRALGGWPLGGRGDDRSPSPPSSSPRRTGRAIPSTPSRVDAGRPLWPGAAVRGAWLRGHVRGRRRAHRARHRRRAGGDGDLALVRQRLVAGHRRRLLPGPSGLDGRRRRCCSPPSAALRPLRRPSLSARLDALVRRRGGSSTSEWRGGDETPQAHAALAGLGRTRQILLSDTLVDTLRDDEVEVVVAHELGHHVHGDVWRAAALAPGGAPADLRCSRAGPARLGAPVGAWPVAATHPASWSSLADALPWLPVLAAAALAVHRVLEPVGLALSRGRRAAAPTPTPSRLTGGADAFVTSMRRLSQTNLVDDRPPRLARCCRRTRRCAIACSRRCATARGRSPARRGQREFGGARLRRRTTSSPCSSWGRPSAPVSEQ